MVPPAMTGTGSVVTVGVAARLRHRRDRKSSVVAGHRAGHPLRHGAGDDRVM